MSVCYPLFWTDWQYSLTGDDYVSVLSSLLNRLAVQPDRWWLCQCVILSSEQTGSTAWQVMTMSVCYPLFWTDWQCSDTGDDYVSVLSCLLNRLAVQRHRWWLCQCVILSSEQTGSTATQVMTMSVCYPVFWTDWQYSLTGDDYVSVLSSLLNRLAVQPDRWWLCQCVIFILSSEQTGSTAWQVMTMSVCYLYPLFWTDWLYSLTGDDYVSVLSCLLNRLAVQPDRWWLCQCVILSSEQTGSTAWQVMTSVLPLFWTDWLYSLTGDDYVSVLSCLLNRLAVQRHRWWLCQCVILSFEQTGSTVTIPSPPTGTSTCGTSLLILPTTDTRMRIWSCGCAPRPCPPSASCTAASTTMEPSAMDCLLALTKSPSTIVSVCVCVCVCVHTCSCLNVRINVSAQRETCT